MLTQAEHLDNLVRHIELVRNNGLVLGKKLISKGQEEFGRILIANCFVHDASKIYGIEWEYLHAGKDVDADKLELAISQHVHTNNHHAEYWGGFEYMPGIAIAEMVCDIHARGQEFGTGTMDWIEDVFIEKYKVKKDRKYKQMIEFVKMLTENHFK
jgi:hypothetical protein